MKKKFDGFSHGVGPIFYFTLFIGLWMSLVYWGKDLDPRLKSISLVFGSSFLEWAFIFFLLPVITWFWTKKEKKDRWREYKKKTLFSGRLARYLLKNHKPLSPHSFAHREFGLDDIQIYLHLLSERGVLREIPRNDREFIYLSNEAQIKKSPVRLKRYFRIYPPPYLTLLFLGIFLALLCYLFPSIPQLGLKGETSYLTKLIVENTIGALVPIYSGNKTIALIFIFVFAMVVVMEKAVLKKWKEMQDKKRQKILFQLARKNKGRVNSSSVCLALGLPLHKARDYLDFLQSKGLARTEFDENGRIFHQIAV